MCLRSSRSQSKLIRRMTGGSFSYHLFLFSRIRRDCCFAGGIEMFPLARTSLEQIKFIQFHNSPRHPPPTSRAEKRSRSATIIQFCRQIFNSPPAQITFARVFISIKSQLIKWASRRQSTFNSAHPTSCGGGRLVNKFRIISFVVSQHQLHSASH